MTVRRAADADTSEWLRRRCTLWPDAEPATLRRELDAMLRSERMATFVSVRTEGGLSGLLEASLGD